MKNPKALARVVGVLYLAVAIFGGWAQLVARSAVHVPGDATATTENLVQNAGLYRAGLVSDMLMATVFVFLGLALYRLFFDASARLATILMVFVSVSAGSILVNLIFHFGALLVATDPAYLAAFGTDARDGLVLLLVELHQYGYSLGGVFFGLWLLPVGIVGYRSGMFPRWFAVIVIVGSLIWMLDPFVVFAAPEAPEFIRVAISAIPAIAEVGLILFLLIVGVLRPKSAAVAA